MIKLSNILQESILTPRRSKEDREKNYKISLNKRIQKYIKDGCKGDLDLSDPLITDFPKGITTIGGSLMLQHSNITELPDNLHIKDSLMIYDNKLTTLPKGLKVDEYVHMGNSNIAYLPSDMIVGRDIFARHSLLKKWTGTIVNGDLYIENSSLGNHVYGLIEIFCKRYDYINREKMNREKLYLLLQRGAKVTQKALNIAKDNCDDDIYKLLLEEQRTQKGENFKGKVRNTVSYLKSWITG